VLAVLLFPKVHFASFRGPQNVRLVAGQMETSWYVQTTVDTLSTVYYALRVQFTKVAEKKGHVLARHARLEATSL